MSVRCRVGETVREGYAIGIDRAVEPGVLARAVRHKEPVADGRVRVECPDPGPVHEHVGCVRPETSVRVRTALARAGRSRGRSTPVDRELAAVAAELEDLSVDGTDLAARRRELAAADADVERLRERVAAARGRLQTRREADLDPGPARRAVAEAVQELAEAETTAAAARQQLADARERARERRDRRDRRLRLEDRAANLRREARAHLVEELREAYERAAGRLGADAPFAADGPTAALAIAQVAAIEAPIVLACDRFETPAAASRWLGVPVIEI